MIIFTIFNDKHIFHLFLKKKTIHKKHKFICFQKIGLNVKKF